MKKKFISSWFYSSLGSIEVEKGLIKKKTEKHVSQRHVDFDDFSERLCKTYEEFDLAGYKVINVLPIQMGQSESSIGKTKEIVSKPNYLGEVGFSITRGAVIIGKLKGE